MQIPNPAPTIKDVAAKAGVSTSLVSLVINNRPKVSPHREAMVRAAMAELGYVPPPPGRRRGPRLNSHRRTHRIAMVVTSIETVLLQAPVYAELLRSVADAVASLGKSLTLHQLTGSESTPELVSALRSSDGAVFLGRPVRGPLLRELQSRPCVRVMGMHDVQGYWDHVTYNNVVIGQMAAEYLLSKGCSHALFMGPVDQKPEGDALTSERGFHFRRVLEEAGCRVSSTGVEQFVIRDGNNHAVDTAGFGRAIDRFLAGPNPPTAIFVPGDLLASTLHSMLLARGRHPGRDVQIVSVNNERLLLDHLIPRPATIDIHADKIGKAAVDLLNRRISDPSLPRSVLVLQPTMVPGGDYVPLGSESLAD